MQCPHCGGSIPKSHIAAALASGSTAAKAESSSENGTNWKRPHLHKVEHFLGLRLFDNLIATEFRVKIPMSDGSKYNPDYYHPGSDTYIEICTSGPNLAEQGWKWREAIKKSNLRVFWWEGEEMTDALTRSPGYSKVFQLAGVHNYRQGK